MGEKMPEKVFPCAIHLLSRPLPTDAGVRTQTHIICTLFPPSLLVQLSQLSASEPKLMGKSNDQREAKPRARAGARTQPLLLDGKSWKPSLSHLEMLMRLANSHWSWVVVCTLMPSTAAPVPFCRAIPRGLKSPQQPLISHSACLPAGRIFSTR